MPLMLHFVEVSAPMVLVAPIGIVSCSSLVAPIHRSHEFVIGFFSNVVGLSQEMLGFYEGKKEEESKQEELNVGLQE